MARDKGRRNRGRRTDFRLAVIGRPNVGKSTLFNRLVGKRLAIVDDRPGVTRDLREGEARLGDLRFTVIDTAGLEAARDDSLPGRMRRLTERAIGEADAVLFLVDARAGLTPVDFELADMLRRAGKPVILAANKAEGRAGEAGLIEAWEVGLGEPLALSAEHGEGMAELAARLEDLIDKHSGKGRENDAAAEEAAGLAGEKDGASPDEEDAAHANAMPEIELAIEEGSEEGGDTRRVLDREKPLQVAIIGRPNAGKSTLVNAILGEERLLTGPEAGITRDAISVRTDWGGVPMRIFDTAGMRKKARVQDRLEKLSVADALRAAKFAEVVVVLLDAERPFESQDLRIADLAAREGRAVVVAVNKWDKVEDRQAKLRELREMFDRLLPQLRGAPLVTLSAKTGKGLDRLREAILDAWEVWNRRIPTSKLNRWLAEAVAMHPPPAPGGRRIKLRYITQAKTRPPTFVLFSPRAAEVPQDYRRYLVQSLREVFDLPGTPIRLNLRATENPYAGKARKKGRAKKGR